MEYTTPVSSVLEKTNIFYRLYQHPGPIYSLEQAARERGQRPEQVVRSILFRLGGGEYVMVLVAGPDQVSWPALRHYLNKSRLTLASEVDVLEVTGYPIGAVSPFGLPVPMRILIDESVLEVDEISIGSGVRGITVILKAKDLLKALPSSEVGRFQ